MKASNCDQICAAVLVSVEAPVPKPPDPTFTKLISEADAGM